MVVTFDSEFDIVVKFVDIWLVNVKFVEYGVVTDGKNVLDIVLFCCAIVVL